jgi:hypothetical protein
MAIKALHIQDSYFTGQELWSESQFVGLYLGLYLGEFLG